METEITSLLIDLNKYTRCSFSCILYKSDIIVDSYCENEKTHFEKFEGLIKQHIGFLNEIKPTTKTNLGIIHLFNMNDKLKLVIISPHMLNDAKIIGYISETIDCIIQLVNAVVNSYSRTFYCDNNSPSGNSSGTPAELSLFIKKPQ